MTSANLKILEEFRDDIDAICSALLELREENEELKEDVYDLKEEINNHECTI